MSKRYFHIFDGKREGPFTAKQIRQRVAAGVLQLNHHIQEEGNPKAHEAQRVSGLFSIASSRLTRGTAESTIQTQVEGDQTSSPVQAATAGEQSMASAPVAPKSAPNSGRKGTRTLWEDLVVTGFGFATSTAVAWLSWLLAAKWGFAIYAWMFWFVIPVGAGFCGAIAASGYWIGARLFNHRPSPLLLLNILLVSLSTYFAIHQFHYSNDVVSGVPISGVMSFSEYLVKVTENMTYSTYHRGREVGSGLELGKLGWGVAVLQIIGFSIGGFVVYSCLLEVPYCNRCAKYFGEKQSRCVQWSDANSLADAYETIVNLMDGQHFQAAVDRLSTLGEQSKQAKTALLSLEVQKCPSCENRRLLLRARTLNGKEWTTVGMKSLYAETPLQLT
jgi:hypothetical protein